MHRDRYLYITTPVFYPNDKPHLGHAFTVIFADCMKRYYANLGYRCWLSVGTDEHGEKIFKAAKESGLPVEEFIDKNVEKFRELWHKLGIKYDKFLRTSDYAHKHLVRKIFTQFENINQIFFDDWRGWYCTSCEENYSIRSIGKNAVCRLGHPLVMHNEKSYFLRTSPYKSWLTKEYNDNENWIYPSHYKKEMINNFINDLDDLSITREHLEWGIKVPDREDHTIYVWFDALINYLTVLNYGNYGKTNTNTFQTYWDNPDAKIIHIIGKEICRFHSIYWPVILKNLDLRMFDQLLVHGWLLMDNEKMSKSKKNVLDPAEMLKIFSRDTLRFYLVKLNFVNDNQVSLNDVAIAYNTYLANTMGNMFSRFYGIMYRKYNYVLPDKFDLDASIELEQINIELDTLLNEKYPKLISSHSFNVLIEEVFDLFRSTGKVIEKNKAWELEASDPVLKATVCFVYKLLCIGSWILSPVLIDVAPKIYEMLNISAKKISRSYLIQQRLFCKKTINPLKEILFPRIKENFEGSEGQ